MQYEKIINKMSLEEKASLMSGQNFWNTKEISRLGIPSMMITDGPHGLRKQGGKADHLGLHKSLPATCFPTAATLANSWDPDLLEKIGNCLGKEASNQQVSVICGPGLNIKRNPLCGRNFEYFSEDPYLSGTLAAAMIQGIQSQKVAACPKHFAVNSQEERRMVMNEVVDERALREIYLEGFRYAIQKGKAKSIMTAYNQVNSCYANENMHLMQDILYGEWGFDGVAITDWGGENDRVKGLIAGNQLEMPSSGGVTDKEIVMAVKEGRLDENLLNKRVNSFLSLLYETRPNYVRESNTEDHHQIAREAAAQSIVLLKNTNRILPISNKSKVAIIGDFAHTPRYQGAGSSLINPTKLDSFVDIIKEENLQITGFQPGFKRLGGSDKIKQRKAIKLAQKSDIVLLFLGLDEGSEAEGIDRPHMRLPENQINLLNSISLVAKNIIVILSGGSPIEMPWSDKVSAILHGYLGGQAGAGAIADILLGKLSPSGKLAESYPFLYQDVPCSNLYPGKQLSSEHRESIYVGYRYYDTAKKSVKWPFGYGLSYTTFAYSNLCIADESIRFIIKNTGQVAGAEIAQLYVSKADSQVFRANKELKGFAKVLLNPGESREIEIQFDTHTFKYFNVAANTWLEETGEYSIMIGTSSRDIVLEKTLFRTSKTTEDLTFPQPYDKNLIKSYFKAEINQVSDKEFEHLLGFKLPPAKWDKSKPLGYNDTIGQAQHKKGFAHFLYNLIKFVRRCCLLLGKPTAANNVMFAMHLPFRSMPRMSGGKFNTHMLDGLLYMINGRFWYGLKHMLKTCRFRG